MEFSLLGFTRVRLVEELAERASPSCSFDKCNQAPFELLGHKSFQGFPDFEEYREV